MLLLGGKSKVKCVLFRDCLSPQSTGNNRGPPRTIRPVKSKPQIQRRCSNRSQTYARSLSVEPRVPDVRGLNICACCPFVHGPDLRLMDIRMHTI